MLTVLCWPLGSFLEMVSRLSLYLWKFLSFNIIDRDKNYASNVLKKVHKQVNYLLYEKFAGFLNRLKYMTK
jgi:hypothetical protein